MSRCWDVANFCPLVVFVGGVFVAGVRSRCPCSGVYKISLVHRVVGDLPALTARVYGCGQKVGVDTIYDTNLPKVQN